MSITQSIRTILLAGVTAAVLAFTPAAQAHAHHHRPRCHAGHVARRVTVHRHHRRERVWRCEPRHRRHHHRRHQAHTTTTVPPSWVPTPTTPLLGSGNNSDCATTPEPGMQVERVILYWFEPLTDELACAQDATQAGLRLIVSIQYAGSQQEIYSRIADALSLYSPLHPWAISIGNEQELDAYQGGQTAAQYSETWQQVEPLMASEDPQAIRVAGEISPWGLQWFEQAVADGLPGAQAYAAHVYPASGSPWAADPVPFSELAASQHVQAWATEGMCGPNVWTRYGCLPEATLARDGFSLAVEWTASTSGS